MKPFLCLLPLAISTALAAEKTARWNILLLYADDLGYGDLGCYNPESKIPTPHLDRQAKEGLRFTDAHSLSGICTPSRYAMLTGRLHWRDFHGIDSGFDSLFFKPGQLTLQAMLQQSGCATACIGNWHLGWDWSSIRKPGTPPRSKQYDHFDWSKSFRGGPIGHGFEDYFDDNVIYFTADNGTEAYAYARDEKFDHWSSSPLRGLKRENHQLTQHENNHTIPSHHRRSRCRCRTR